MRGEIEVKEDKKRMKEVDRNWKRVNEGGKVGGGMSGHPVHLYEGQVIGVSVLRLVGPVVRVDDHSRDAQALGNTGQTEDLGRSELRRFATCCLVVF